MERITVIGPPGTGKTYYIEQDIRMNSNHYTYIVYNVSMAREARARLGSDKDTTGTLHSQIARRLGLTSFLTEKEQNEWAKKVGLGTVPSSATGESELSRFLSYYDYNANMLMKPTNIIRENLNIPYLTDKYNAYKEKIGKMDYTDILVLGSDHRDFYSPALYVDEAQDLTPLMWRIIDRWQCERMVIVGDDDQAIYAFKGASVSGFRSHVENPVVLGSSFRFGDNLRILGDRIIGAARKIPKPYVGTKNTTIRRVPLNEFAKLEGQKAILVRTNIMAMMISQRNDIAFIPINPEHSLNNGWTHRSLEIIRIMVRFPDITPEEFQYIVKHSPASLWQRGTKARVLKKPSLFSYDLLKEKMSREGIVRKMDLKDKEKEKIIYALIHGMPPVVYLDTLHSSKGLEWDNVLIALDRPGNIIVNDDERRLFYVGATRARSLLTFSFFGYYVGRYDQISSVVKF
jgi:hypothetical protein